MQEIDLATQAQAASKTRQSSPYQLKYDLVLVFITLIWGGTFLVAKETLKLIGPFTYLCLCYTVATLTLVLIFHKRILRITRAELLSGLLIGVALFAGYGFQTVGLQSISVSKAGFITGLYVPLVPLLALVLLRQRISLPAMGGVVLSVIGLFLLASRNQLTPDFGSGEWLVLGGAFAFALQIVFISKFVPRADAINLAIVQIALTALLSLIAIPLNHEPLAPPPAIAWVPVLLMGTADMAFTMLAMNWIQQFLSSTRATLIYALEPIWATFFGVLLAGDRLSLAAWLGCACIFAGMVMGRLERISLRRRKIRA